MEPYFERRDLPAMVDEFSPAVFHVHGTEDENVKTDHFTQMWDALEEEGVERKALLGPWSHQEPSLDWWNLTVLRWFEHHLKGIDTGMMDEPRVTLIDQHGTDRQAEAFPPASAEVESFAAEASDVTNEGQLTQAAPADGEATYVDNPGLHRALLQDAAAHRVTYTSAPLDEPLRLSGTPVAEVNASIEDPDAHLVAYLYDVAPDGEASYVTRGYLDANYRDGVDEEPAPVPEGEAITYAVDMHAREWVFEEDHSLELLLASSDRCPWMVGGPEQLPKCHWSGIVANDHAPVVTVHEGGATQLHLPSAPVGSAS
jgi:X-Pro dipeptidyl-peptidase